MIRTIEERTRKHFPYFFSGTFRSEISSPDFALVYLRSEMRNTFDVERTKKTLQGIINFLKEITSLKLGEGEGNKRLDPKVLIGYRHPDNLDSDETLPSWVSDNTIKLPWDALGEEKQPVEACTHELVHPFLHMTEVGDWGEGFCDFLRIAIVEKFAPRLEWEIDGRLYGWRGFMRENVNREGANWQQHKKALCLLRQFGGGSSSKILGNGSTLVHPEEERLKNFIRPLLNKTSSELDGEIAEQ